MGVVIAVRRNNKEKEIEFEPPTVDSHITWGLERGGGGREYEAAVVIDFLASLASLYRDVCRGIRPG